MLLLALSCLQTRPMAEALAALAPLADGVQLTPGCAPTEGFEGAVERYGRERVRFHHTFAWDAPKRRIYDPDGSMRRALSPWSVHPPLPREGIPYEHWFARATAAPWATEVMYPGEWLGTGAELDRAMDAAMNLAVDVSHLFIQRSAGAVDARTIARLFEYDKVSEVHVSANDGRRDTHAPLTERTFGLEWARARLAAGTPVVLECYMHRLDERARRQQVDLARGC